MYVEGNEKADTTQDVPKISSTRAILSTNVNIVDYSEAELAGKVTEP